MIGRTLAHYEIVELLGRGGMGEVYRARDTKLGREVALKLLPEGLTDDAERVARFRREARTLASLHHPNIASIHGLDEAEGRLFLTMELVEGEDLSQRIARGALAVDEAIEIGVGIAQGLEAAHAQGIVHRDLKPANVKIAPDGTAKILDFGLARALAGESVEEGDIGTSPTITAAMTQAGTILGTAAYMSPEQARGRPVDHRADLWAFGVLLWEMVHGQRLFVGDTTSDVLANVLKQDIDPYDVPRGIPAKVQRVLARCLERDARQRLHSAADARIELQTDEPVTTIAATPGQSRWPWVVTTLVVVAVLLLQWSPWSTPTPREERAMVVSVNFPEGFPFTLIDWSALAVTPDGRYVGVTAELGEVQGIVVRAIEDGGVHMVLDNRRAYNVFFSPDGRWVGYTANNRFWKSSIDGGAPVELVTTAHPRGASWGDRGHVYYVPSYTSGIMRVADTGNAVPETLTVIDAERGERTHRWPHVLPGERGVLYTVGMNTSPGDYEDAEIWVHDLESDTSRFLGVRGALAKYSKTGHLVLARDGVLHAVPFDPERLEVEGTPVPVHEGVRGDPASGMYYFDLDDHGTLYTIAARRGGPRRLLSWVGRDGTVEPIDLPPGSYRYPRLSPEDDRAVLVLGEGHGNNDDVYMLDFDDLTLTRLTFDQSSMIPSWMPGGDEVVFSSVGDGVIRRRRIGSDAGIRDVDNESRIIIPHSVGSDGRTVLCTQLDATSPGDIVHLDLEDGSVEPVVASPAVEWAPTFSSDMRWFAYVSDETGREEIFLQPFPPTGAKWQVSVDGGRAPHWSDDGTEIFFVLGNAMMVASVRTTPEVRVQRPVQLFELRSVDTAGTPIPNYDVSSDGQRFLMVENDRSTETRSVEVHVGWAAKALGKGDF